METFVVLTVGLQCATLIVLLKIKKRLDVGTSSQSTKKLKEELEKLHAQRGF